MFGGNFIDQPLAVLNSFQFAPNNEINLALDFTIPLFSFDNGDNNQAYAFYIRPNIGNIKPWFTESGRPTIAHQVDRRQSNNIANIFQKHFLSFNYSFSMLEIYWNFNNKKNCKITTQLQTGYSQTVFQISNLAVKYSNWGKVVVPGQCLDEDKINKISLVISVPTIKDNVLITKNSYQELYLNFRNRKQTYDQTSKIIGVIQYKNYDEKKKRFQTLQNVFEHYFEFIRALPRGEQIRSLFFVRSFSSFYSNYVSNFPIDFYSKITKLWTFFNNHYLLIPTITTIKSKETKYNFKSLNGYLKYNSQQKLYEHFFTDNMIYNQAKNHIEISTSNNFSNKNFLVHPFLQQTKVTFTTQLEGFNINFTQDITFKPNILRPQINNSFTPEDNWFDNLTMAYYICHQKLTNYYNKEFNQELLTQFDFDFLLATKVVNNEKSFN
ncbi:hypothetical protein [Spiroplasma sp. SV19]|uniref:hypothetical protein n=1 Tax=Spiroplasma sp. SV19 TaxID=2570468 RepID=UPI0024B7A809|nr:hypothetical protein [Spiroplasma sp. SV19]WHQ37266.1 hypothetical protein E7Y35_05205 [Spiroplasma sp. SV19]